MTVACTESDICSHTFTIKPSDPSSISLCEVQSNEHSDHHSEIEHLSILYCLCGLIAASVDSYWCYCSDLAEDFAHT